MGAGTALAGPNIAFRWMLQSGEPSVDKYKNRGKAAVRRWASHASAEIKAGWYKYKTRRAFPCPCHSRSQPELDAAA